MARWIQIENEHTLLTPDSETTKESYHATDSEKHTGSHRGYFCWKRGQHGDCHSWTDADSAPRRRRHDGHGQIRRKSQAARTG